MARPQLSYLKNLILFFFGLPLGMLTGLTGIGSSVFAVPAVRFLVGLRPVRAVGVGLAVTFFAAFASLLSYGQHGFLLVGLALILTVSQIIGAAWGERVTTQFPALERASWLWGTLVAAGGLAMLAHGWGLWGRTHWPPTAAHGILFYLLAALVSLVVGAFSRVIGLGGVLLVPAAIYWLGLAPHQAQGTAIIVLALASLPGMIIHARRGDVEPRAATWLSTGAIFGGLAGALWAVHLPDHFLVFLFGLMLTVLGIMMLWRPAPTPSELEGGG